MPVLRTYILTVRKKTASWHLFLNLRQMLLLFGGSAVLLAMACSRRSQQPAEHILAHVANKTISVNEFIRRAEYTIRPPYCRSDNYIQKKIVLNSLVAEKLLSLEAGENNPLTRSETFQEYIEGRKEQALRQWLFVHDFYDKVKVDASLARQMARVVGRTYRIAYFTVRTPGEAELVHQKLKQGVPFEEVYRQFGGLETLPKRRVRWKETQNEAIEKALYSKPLQKEQIVGPVQAGDRYYTTMKILGWTDELTLTNQQIQQRWNDVVKRLREEEAQRAYLRFVARLMHGRRVEFNRPTFLALVQLYRPIYMKSKQEQKRELQGLLWQHKLPDVFASDSTRAKITQILYQPLLKLDGQTWTVARFLKEEHIHPLVFRKQDISDKEFPEQLKLAIVNLIQDKFVAQEAERKGYDRVNVVQRNVTMWRDHLLAMYQRDRFLDSIGKKEEFDKNYLKVLKQELNPYVRRLQKKYSNRIGIDTDAFEKIKLTRIDMIALQRHVPFPVLVPSFPIVTTLNRLDYGRKIGGALSK